MNTKCLMIQGSITKQNQIKHGVQKRYAIINNDTDI